MKASEGRISSNQNMTVNAPIFQGTINQIRTRTYGNYVCGSIVRIDDYVADFMFEITDIYGKIHM